MPTKTKKTIKAPKLLDLSKMTKAQARVAIANDAIAQIKAKKFVAESMTYCDVISERGQKRQLNSTVNVREMLLSPAAKRCQVCAQGAVFASSVRLFNECEVEPSYAKAAVDGVSLLAMNKASTPISRFFTHAEMDLIERLFEPSFGSPRDLPEAQEDDFWAFKYAYPNLADRMIAIMQLIIDRKGRKIVIPKATAAK